MSRSGNNQSKKVPTVRDLVRHTGNMTIWTAKNLPQPVGIPTMGGKQIWMDRHLYSSWRVQENIYTLHYRLLDPDGRRMAFGDFSYCRERLEDYKKYGEIHAPAPHMVLMIPGIIRSPALFNKMSKTLSDEGYDAAPISYPSTRRNIFDHAKALETLLEGIEETRQISFVTHSMGGLVLRSMLARNGDWMKRISLQSIIMIAPPSQGAVMAHYLRDFWPYQLVYGGAGQELSPQRAGNIPPLEHEFALIAGGRDKPSGYNPLIQGDNDGVVSVKESLLAGAKDFLLVNALHSFIAAHPDTITATVNYLQTGHFAHQNKS